MSLTIIRKRASAINCTPKNWPFPLEPAPHVWNPQTYRCIRCSTPQPPGASNDVFIVPEAMRKEKLKKEVGL